MHRKMQKFTIKIKLLYKFVYNIYNKKDNQDTFWEGSCKIYNVISNLQLKSWPK